LRTTSRWWPLGRACRPPTCRRALEILEGNRRAVAGRNPWVLAAALWLATYKEYGMLIRLAEAAGATVVGVKGAARRMRA